MPTDHFPEAMKFIRLWEGGFVNDPDDAGGATKWGVTQAAYNAHRARNAKPHQPVQLMTEAEATNLYRHDYWSAVPCEGMPLDLAIVAMDTAVNFGPGRIRQWLKITRDPKKIVALRKAYRYARVAAKPSQKKFLKGWLNRDNALGKLVGA